MRRIPHPARLTRDWRIKTLVPVVVINVLAFAALYGLMYHFAVSNLIKVQQAAGSVLLDELEFNFPEMMRDRSGTALRARMNREAALHNLADVNVFDSRAEPAVMTFGEPPAPIRRAVQSALAANATTTTWIMEPGAKTLLVGIRPLANRAECQQCHIATVERLGALQMTIDLTQPMNASKEVVRTRFAIAGVTWIGLLALMFWTGGVVIGRPLKRIQQTLAGTDGKDQDLEALAGRIDRTILSILERQREREEDIARQMVRAEQLATLGELAAGLTHEIKNPIAGVIAALEVSRSEESISDELFDQMIAELRRATTTLDSLLRLARPQPPQRTSTDLGRVVRDLAAIFTARFRRQGVDLEIHTADKVPLIALDTGLMSQLIVNLLTNSVQATDRNGKVSVYVTPFPRGNGVVLIVSDTGRGISAEHLDSIFDPFFTTKEDGTGLGLAICRQIVTQHGGTISIESEPGKGTRVIVLLPGEEFHGVAAAG
jgi:signal transduction histidine kinase